MTYITPVQVGLFLMRLIKADHLSLYCLTLESHGLFILFEHKDEFNSKLKILWEIEGYFTQNDSLYISEKEWKDYYSETTTRYSKDCCMVHLKL